MKKIGFFLKAIIDDKFGFLLEGIIDEKNWIFIGRHNR